MLECKLCNYYKTLSGHSCSNADVSKCEFTGTSFFGDVENFDIEYPCKNISYMSYLNKASEIKSNVNIFMSEDWQHVYKKDHLKEATDRVGRRSV